MVCGDETQKPFPLLVWDLKEKKLVYDLRQVNHDFMTELSAIDDEGHYVACVCQELNSTEANYVVVYDLQSGTVFKKWKPGSPVSSLAIASSTKMVIVGTHNCSIRIYELMSGTSKYQLRLHNYPATNLAISEDGKRCLSWSRKENCLRLWDIVNGVYLGGFSPDSEISCAELSFDGSMVLFALHASTLVYCLSTLLGKDVAKRNKSEAEIEAKSYGDPELSLVDLNAK